MMIEITFKGFYEYKYREDGFHELYVMKNGFEDILYVGISIKTSGIVGLAGMGLLWMVLILWLEKVQLGERLWIICQILGIGKFNYGHSMIVWHFARTRLIQMEDIPSKW